jgi:hypothetical protein
MVFAFPMKHDGHAKMFPGSLVNFKSVSEAERLGGRPRRGKGSRISGRNKERSGAADLKFSKGASLGWSQVCRILRRGVAGSAMAGSLGDGAKAFGSLLGL